VDYIRTVKVMQNQMDCNQLDLSSTLPPATIMIVSVTSSTTQGKPLNEAELAELLEACNMALDLCDAKNKIFDYVESRMFFLSPNLTHICGANTAAKMMGSAGGLTALSKMPACNILVLGSTKKALGGFSAMQMLPHTGFIYYCDVVQKQAHEYRKKAARMVAAKCALAARVDSYYDERSKGATVGIGFREDILKKLAKAQEPPPAKLQKALPAPDMNTKKKRGGKRVRKQKDRYTMSETRKAANRVGFGEIEEDVFQDEMGFSLGQLGKGGTSAGHFRAPESNKRKAGAISKKMAKRMAAQQQRTGGLASSIRSDLSSSGTASVAFTPVQGLEINRSMLEKKKEDPTDRYFSSAGFAGLKK
jgi:U4/U6 small nuclear ribonucleoprotein PRP31